MRTHIEPHAHTRTHSRTLSPKNIVSNFWMEGIPGNLKGTRKGILVVKFILNSTIFTWWPLSRDRCWVKSSINRVHNCKQHSSIHNWKPYRSTLTKGNPLTSVKYNELDISHVAEFCLGDSYVRVTTIYYHLFPAANGCSSQDLGSFSDLLYWSL